MGLGVKVQLSTEGGRIEGWFVERTASPGGSETIIWDEVLASGSEVTVGRSATGSASAGIGADGFAFAAHCEDGCEFLYFVHFL